MAGFGARAGTESRHLRLVREDDVRQAYAAHGAEVYRLAHRALGDAAAAQDVVQETFLRAWRAGERFDPTRASLRTWLFAIARNVVTDAARARAVRPVTTELSPQTHPPAASVDEWEALVRRMLVETALGRIGAEHRQALQQTYLADRPCSEVAAELGIPESTLRSRVFYGLKALRIAMEEMEVAP